MAEINLDGATIFVDVGAGQQYPIMYTQVVNMTQEQQQQNVADSLEEKSVKENQTVKVEGVATVQKSVDKEISEENVPVKEKPPTPPGVKIQARRVRCPECHRFTAETEEKMLRHIRRVHRGENPFQCYMCDYSTYNKAVFEEHVNIHQGIKPYKCSHCPYKSASKKNTKKHELIHRPDNPLKCSECSFIARHQKALDHHKKKHIVKKNVCSEDYTCDVCSKTFTEKEKYRNHWKNRLSCKQCDFVTCSRNKMSLHRQELHDGCGDKISKGNMFFCALCKWSSLNKPRILLHLIHHPKQKVDENVIDVSMLRELGIME